MIERRLRILDTISDLAVNFLYYDRIGDERLPQGAIEEAIKAGEITQQEIVKVFADELAEALEEE